MDRTENPEETLFRGHPLEGMGVLSRQIKGRPVTRVPPDPDRRWVGRMVVGRVTDRISATIYLLVPYSTTFPGRWSLEP